MNALVLALPESQDPVVTGLTLVERARRVCRLAGVPRERIFVARSGAEVSALRLGDEPLLVVRADGWVVAAPLVEPLRLTEGGDRRAVDAEGKYAGALRVDHPADVLKALEADFAAGDANCLAENVPVGRRARHPARDAAELAAADAWQFELVHKALDDALVRYFYRPLARPLTRLFLISPFTPNMITILSVGLSLAGCAIAAGAGYGAHVLGLFILVIGGIVDANDGEVARLRLEGSKLGGWLDAIGDDLARLALLLAIGFHVAPRWPSWPVIPVTLLALVLTVSALAMIYWYCIFVIHSSNNQDYGAVLGVGNDAPGERTLWRKIADLAAHAARRDVMDLGMLGFALLDLPEISLAVLVVGAGVSFGVVLPAHLRLLAKRRQGVM